MAGEQPIQQQRHLRLMLAEGFSQRLQLRQSILLAADKAFLPFGKQLFLDIDLFDQAVELLLRGGQRWLRLFGRDADNLAGRHGTPENDITEG
ncbi:MAG: hypothetical protein AB1705_19980 [Verrucomicrobiota bacterium]